MLTQSRVIACMLLSANAFASPLCRYTSAVGNFELQKRIQEQDRCNSGQDRAIQFCPYPLVLNAVPDEPDNMAECEYWNLDRYTANELESDDDVCIPFPSSILSKAENIAHDPLAMYVLFGPDPGLKCIMYKSKNCDQASQTGGEDACGFVCPGRSFLLERDKEEDEWEYSYRCFQDYDAFNRLNAFSVGDEGSGVCS